MGLNECSRSVRDLGLVKRNLVLKISLILKGISKNATNLLHVINATGLLPLYQAATSLLKLGDFGGLLQFVETTLSKRHTAEVSVITAISENSF